MVPGGHNGNPGSHLRARFPLLAVVAALLAWSVAPPGASQARAQGGASGEVTVKESRPQYILKTERNLVLVRVVVRDPKGQPVKGLSKEDFALRDDGKPQKITHFSMEGAGVTSPAEKATPARPPSSRPSEEAPETPPALLRFLGLFFDDSYLKFEDIFRAREAAERFLRSQSRPEDRVAVFTTSGTGAQEFTDDRDTVDAALLRILPRPRAIVPTGQDCPDISDYLADLIVNHNDPDALALVVYDDIHVCQDDSRGAEERMRSRARQVLQQFQTEAQLNLAALDQAIRRLAAAPGERQLIWVSGGFLLLDFRMLSGEVADRAVRSNVVISVLDPRGLVTLLPMADVTTESGVGNPRLTVGLRTQYGTGRELQASEVLREMAQTTGGEYFHNNNDLDAGFRKVAAPPDIYYMLAFSPQNLKLDGKFHRLKVDLVNGHGLSVIARSGYFAPRKPSDSKAQAEEEVMQAAFSYEEMMELPAQLSTQFFKISDTEAQLSVTVHFDVHPLRFRREADRNAADLRIVTVLFDQDGNYVDGQEKQLELRLRDATLKELLDSGIRVRSRFKVPPGTYRIREVVRDLEGGQLSAVNQSVQIPY
jgi:VWFA-related protein